MFTARSIIGLHNLEDFLNLIFYEKWGTKKSKMKILTQKK